MASNITTPSVGLGDTFAIRWEITYYDGLPFPLGNYAVRLFMQSQKGRAECLDLTVDGNAVQWEFAGDKQTTGTFTFVLMIGDGKSLSARRQWTHAVRITQDCATPTGLVIVHTSALDMLSSAVDILNKLDQDAVDGAVASIGTLDARVSALELDDIDAKDTEDTEEYPDLDTEE